MNDIHNFFTTELITEPESLLASGKIGEDECRSIRSVIQTYKMGVSPYYAGLIDWQDPECPVRKQCIPSINELNSSPHMADDPLAEKKLSPAPCLTHKYPDRVALYISNRCFTYCRHCTRKNTVIADSPAAVSEDDFIRACDYIRSETKIRDVLLTGGDPLALPDDLLERYIREIRRIPHVQTIRIGTRAIVTHPARITEALADMLKRYHPVWVNTQFNHPKEITEQAVRAADILLSRGIPVGNQSVLLKGINNDIEIIKELLLKLIQNRIRPYYLYQADSVRGTEHFITSYLEGVRIISMLRHNISGYAIPRFVIDVPGENGSKVIAEESGILSAGCGQVVLRGMNGINLTYRDGVTSC